MRVTDGIVFLAQPVFGRTVLTGTTNVMTTMLDFTFSEPLSAAELGLEGEQFSVMPLRVLIPLSNVLAIIVEHERLEEVGVTYKVPNYNLQG